MIGIVLLGLNLRAAITSLPPVFPQLSSSLGLSTASLAMLATLPVLCFAVCSVPAGWVGRRLGEERVLMGAVLLLALGLVARGALPATLLFPGTAAACAAIALMNVLLPSLVKRRDPRRAGMLIGGYLLMLSAGQVVSTAIAVPVFRYVAGHSAAAGSRAGGLPIRVTLGLWAFPAVLAALVWLPQLWRRTREGGVWAADRAGDGTAASAATPTASAAENGAVKNGAKASAKNGAKAGQANANGNGSAAKSTPAKSSTVTSSTVKVSAAKAGAADKSGPDRAATGKEREPGHRPDSPPPARGRGVREGVFVHRQFLGWQVAAYVGLTGVLFYAPLSWLPTLLQSRGMSAGGAGDVLALMNVGNAISALTVPMLAHRAPSQRLLVAGTSVAVAVGLCGEAFAPIGLTAAPAFLLGLGQGAGLGLGTFFSMARAPDPKAAASLSGFAQSVGYLLAAIGPPAVAFLHTYTRGWDAPVAALVGFICLQAWSGCLAGRARTLRLITVPQSTRHRGALPAEAVAMELPKLS